MKKQTAVEWLEEKLNKILIDNQIQQTEHLFEQAKEMFEEQMFEFWQGGINCTEEDGKSFDQYFNKTYKQQKP